MTNLEKQFVEDMGFGELYSGHWPLWAIELAERMINVGWKKDSPNA